MTNGEHGCTEMRALGMAGTSGRWFKSQTRSYHVCGFIRNHAVLVGFTNVGTSLPAFPEHQDDTPLYK